MIEIRLTFMDDTDMVYEVDSEYSYTCTTGYIMIANNFEHSTDYIPLHQLKGIRVTQKF